MIRINGVIKISGVSQISGVILTSGVMQISEVPTKEPIQINLLQISGIKIIKRAGRTADKVIGWNRDRYILGEVWTEEPGPMVTVVIKIIKVDQQTVIHLMVDH